jgi:hypothetical protein
MDEGNPSKAPCVNNGGIKPINIDLRKPLLGKPDLSQQIAQQQAQMEIAKQQAMMQEVAKTTTYSGLTDKVFGKSQQGAGLDPKRVRIGAYVILGAVVGRYVAKNMGKSTTLGMVVGGLAPLLAYQLTLEYDKKKTLKQLPEPKSAIKPTPEGGGRDKFGMPIIKPLTMAEEREMAIRFYKTLPDEFVLNNVRYFKNSNLEFYKQPFSSEGLSGVMPIKIGGAEFSDAYIKFRDKDLPKSPFDAILRTDNTLIK